ncbi:DNA translocase FtsK 4TM domain-containing protein [Candidatus Saccharibacteria bacterium]|nr:DNA translocase FtsK 4TM domain-containing protein [Candidatus Saccharibacteria bacterium]
MAKKRKTIKKSKKTTSQHVLPTGFWAQVIGVVLVVLALLLVVAMFSAGGPILGIIFNACLVTIGWTTYILPVLLVLVAIEIFRAEDNKLSGLVVFASVLLVVWLSGLLQLLATDPKDMDAAIAGQGGGFVGWLLDQAVLSMLSVPIAGFVLIVLSLITILFVLKVSPKTLFDLIKKLFEREEDSENSKLSSLIRKNNGDEIKGEVPSKTAGQIKLNEGVPTLQFDDEKKGKLSSLKGSVARDKAAEEQSALTTFTDPNWQAPSLDLLEKKQNPADAGDVQHNSQVIHDTLAEFNINVEMENANIGPKVTQYTLKPPSGVKLTRITQLETNIALNLAAQSLRMEAPIPGQKAVGIEVPNRKAADVRIRGILDSDQWRSVREPLGFTIGRDIAGDAVVGELNKMPHLLIAGQTGSGKSVMINTLLTSLLYRNSPSDMKLILVDPKQVEMAPYSDIPHLLAPVITKPEECISALKWAVNEMERRYNLLAEERLRDIKSYNQKKKDEGMPYIVIVIDELADLMMIAARDVEALIVRLAQKARAVGIHLVLATQRPSVDVITGLIKANIPARIAFTVASQVDSRTILDQIGAEKLLGQGDMLLLTPEMSKPKRIQGAWVMEDEVQKVTDHMRMQREPQYDPEITKQPVNLSGKGGVVMDMDGAGDDDLYRDALQVVVDSGKASASLLQRRLRVGYARAARLIETMEDQGVIGPADGARPREVLISSLDDLGGGDDEE